MKRNWILPFEITMFLILWTGIVFTVSAAPEDSKDRHYLPAVRGPYTVYVLSDGVYRIEDANETNPAGLVLDENGKIVHMNNSSDMYLVTGSRKALLIDLSDKLEIHGGHAWQRENSKKLTARYVYDMRTLI
jgi:hypothetical protein